jgi:hypothetical protein
MAIPCGRGLGKEIERIGKEHAAIRAELKKLRPHLYWLRGAPRADLERLIAEYLPEENAVLPRMRRRPRVASKIRKTSHDYAAEAEYLRATAKLWRMRGRLREARECEEEARRLERKGAARKAQGH